MALTLTEGEKYSTTEMDRAVIDRLTKDSVVLQRLPFIEILGNSLTYDTITTDSTASYYSVGDTWTESTPSITQATATLKILGKDADIDNFLLATRSNKLDLKGTVLGNAVKVVQTKYIDGFYYGDASTDTKTFNGLHKLLTSTTYNTVEEGSGTAASVLNISNWRKAMDLIKGRKPSLMTMTLGMRRSVATYLDSVGDKFPREVNAFGKTVETFDGIEIAPDEHMVATELLAGGSYSAKTGGASTSIFIMAFDEDAITGIQGPDSIVTVPLGDLETKDANRWRIKWYCGLMFQDLRASSHLTGVLEAGTVAA